MKAKLNWIQRQAVSALGLRGLAENPTYSLADPRVVAELFNRGTAFDVNVTRENALTVSPFAACISLIGSSFSKLPARVYRRDDNGNLVPNNGDRRERILNGEPVPFLSSMAWRGMGIVHLGTHGNFYNVIERNQRGEFLNFMPVEPSRVAVKRRGRELVYEIRLSDSKASQEKEIVPERDMLHVKVDWLLRDGLVAQSPVDNLKMDLETLAAVQMFTKNYFENGARPGSAFTLQEVLSEDAYNRLKASVNEQFQGAKNSHKPILLEGGADVKMLGQTFDETFLLIQERAKRNVCATLLVPPGMVGEERDVNRSTAEEDSLRFVKHTLSAWVRAWEEEINRKLFPQSPLFVRFDMDNLLRGDTASRHEAYSKALGGQPYKTVNEVRAEEHLPPVQNGDTIKEPLNMGKTGGDPGDAAQ